jgi:valacyclovir hydrolase
MTNVTTPAYRLLTLADGQSFAYVDIGVGPPVVLLHGFTGRAVTHMDLLINALRATHRVIGPDLRGYGLSAPPRRTFAPGFYAQDADDVAALLRRLDCGPAVAMGFSDGAESALLLAARHPALVSGVVAWGVSGVISRAMAESVTGWLEPAGWAATHQEWAAEIVREHGDDQIEPLIGGWARAAHAIYAAGGNICLAEAAAIRCPVLLLNGEGEVNNTREDTLALQARIDDCRLRLIPHAGHAIQWDQPDALMAEIQAFLAMLDAGQ